MSQSLEFCEFEVKFRTTENKLIKFKQLVDAIKEDKTFCYIEGSDRLFTYPESWFRANSMWDRQGTFVRYRKPSHGLDGGRRQVSWKYKPKGAKDSIKRKEHNWELGDTPEQVVIEQLQDSGTKFNFSIHKLCHIFQFVDAVVVFYTVYDTTDDKPGRASSFIEIEVLEETIAQLSEDQAWAVIHKYEKVLAPLGVSARKRMTKSLFEMYRRD